MYKVNFVDPGDKFGLCANENLKSRRIPGFIMKRVENMDEMVNRGVNYSTSFCT